MRFSFPLFFGLSLSEDESFSLSEESLNGLFFFGGVLDFDLDDSLFLPTLVHQGGVGSESDSDEELYGFGFDLVFGLSLSELLSEYALPFLSSCFDRESLLSLLDFFELPEEEVASFLATCFDQLSDDSLLLSSFFTYFFYSEGEDFSSSESL